MRPRIPLATRVASMVDMPETEVQWVLDNPDEHQTSSPCWSWHGAFSGITPVIHHNGRVQAARRVLFEACHGELTPADRVSPACVTLACVNPEHSRAAATSNVKFMVAQATPAGADYDIDEVIDAVYSQDQPWDAPALAAYLGYPEQQVLIAIQKIAAEGL